MIVGVFVHVTICVYGSAPTGREDDERDEDEAGLDEVRRERVARGRQPGESSRRVRRGRG